MYDIAVLSVVLSIVVGGTAAAWLLTRHDRTSAAFVLGAFLLTLSVWTATHLGTLFAESLQWLLLFKQLSYVGVVTAPLAWFVFAIRYTDRSEWLSTPRLVLLLLVPVLTLLTVFTAQYHSLFYSSIGVETVDGRALLQTSGGPMHVVNVVYAYSLMLAGTGLLIVAALSDNRLYRYQSAVLLSSSTIPWLVNMLYHLDLKPFPWFDATPMAFIATGIPLAVIVVRTNLASFLPVAHERVFRSLDEPVLVVTPAGQILDTNDAAQRVLGGSTPLEGSHVEAILPPELLDGQTLRTDFDGHMELSLDWNGDSRGYLARRYDIEPDHGGTSRGSVVTMTDITEQNRREQELRQLSEQTKRKNEQLERIAEVISHDLAAPLSTAEKTLSLLRADLNDPNPHVQQSLVDLDTVHDRLRGFAEHLPRLARESIDVETTEVCDLATVAQAAWNTVDTADIELIVTDSRAVNADRQRLQQVFENLFRNTVEHGSPVTRTVSDKTPKTETHDRQTPMSHGGQKCPSHEQSGATAVRVGTAGGVVFVEDDGPGINPEQREAIFQYGMSTGDSSGFGLAIVRTIVEAHGWEIRVAEAESGGARFEITGVALAAE
ncbi:MAG: histidine kinase N-terminal 7TM domain-containing protein [archaeon]